MAEQFQIRECLNSLCGLRYPLVRGHPFGTRCPKCLGSTRAALTRNLPSGEPHSPAPVAFRIAALLDNLRSAWNVGAIFRTADGLGVDRLYLCGITPTPESASLAKTALGAERTLAWEHHPNAIILADALKRNGCCLAGLEQAPHAASIYASEFPPLGSRRIVLVVGNEVAGVDPEVLGLCEEIYHIPMVGTKRSLNVEVAFAIAASTIIQRHSQPFAR